MCLKKSLLLALLMTTTAAHAQTLSPKIVGGENAGDGYPWMAGLHVYNPDSMRYFVYPFCGGSLIAPGWVLTAAHCLDDGITAAEVLVRIDQPDICDTLGCPDGSEIPPDYEAMTLLIHDSYADVTSGFDIALVQLSGKVNLDTVSIADATTMSELNALSSDNGAVAAIGWGVYDDATFDPRNAGDGNQPEMLQFVALDYLRRTLIPGAKPANVVGAWEPSPNSSTQPDGADTCFGDSGGPLFVPQGNIEVVQSSADPVLVGLTSYGSGDCNSRLDPGVYTQVSAYTDWIEQQSADQGDPLVDLQISVSHPVTDQLPGSSSDNFTVTVTNNSSRNSVSDFSVQITGEADVSVAPSADTTLSCSQTTSIKLDCDSTASLAPGASTVYHFSVTDIADTIRYSTLDVSLTAQASDDYRRSNNSDSFDIFYTDGPDLEVDLDAFNASNGSFEMRVENNSDVFAGTDIVLTFNSNLALRFTDSGPCAATSDTQVVCTLDTLAAGTTFTRVITLPRSRSEMLSYDLEASITQTSADPFAANDSDAELGFVVAKLPRRSSGGGSALWLVCIALGAGLRRRR